ncbi:acyl-CoA carboxylase subunit beta [Bifidobacterium gallicum]|uniref:Carboxyl transferase domain protein n=1 Tax=Bifidobacterium gallicum DSM 20093 = LMG 11596 TaxID=561180 RepID=D1NVL6_9BIFI|nr:acyl-CoA carboxylase subunit beta [Bifidobacterium gallicum]EFA22867.1 carboxyl transferase domain protein [Bifidobacterium gallicum DSM 20093 = LMG 11596]KFI59425.1 methylmalonyl-CoA carboxyltransferase [Bifidobacterium gallicum DSM 20093 = LMG 11596]
MTDITQSPNVLAFADASGDFNEAVSRVEASEQARVEAAGAAATAGTPGAQTAAAGERQPIRAAVLKAAQLARDAEEHARTKQHVKGKLTARERLDLLLDTGSFEEIGRFSGGSINGGVAGAAVITGFGRIYGRTVAVYAQDFSVRGGSLGAAEGRKICRLMDEALALGVPVIALIDSGGARIQEGVAALTEYGHIFRRTCQASGFVPQVSLILGPCAGGAVYCPALTDLIVMTRENSNMFVTGPDVIKAATGETISMDDLGGGHVHATTSGVAHYLGEDESDAIDYVRTVLAYLPANASGPLPHYDYMATRADHEVAKRLAGIVPANERQPYDVTDVIRCIVDYGEFVQVHELFAPSAVVGFACMDGNPVGIVANQPAVLAGSLDVDASEKVARFVRLCDAFNLPVITLVDTPGYKPGAEQEHAGIIRRGAKVIYAYASAQVPLITVILRKAFGGAYIVMGSKSIGADLNFAWPSSQIAVLGATGAANILHRRDLQKAKDQGKDVEAERARYAAEYERTTVNANLSMEMGEVDAMIDPEQTRETLLHGLATLRTKQRRRVTGRHHANPPL